jgi:hypothetical protein
MIGFVERNVNAIILAITVIVMLALGMNIITLAFLWYELIALVFSCFVLPLIWIPPDSVKQLVELRHIKTVPYFYAVFLFLSGVISMGISLT